jgi:hypothetical protein
LSIEADRGATGLMVMHGIAPGCAFGNHLPKYGGRTSGGRQIFPRKNLKTVVFILEKSFCC